MFDSLLIANRGEIACRIIETARRLGIRSVAVYSDADSGARHVEMADQAIHIGPAPARESYLNIAAIIDAARRTGAGAIHPGYGFLSENPELARACAAAGIAFIGPPEAAMRAMGSKSAAKALMEKAGVPLLPGYHGADQDLEIMAGAARAIGYPILVKASAGGGGKGMRVVARPEDLTAALDAARREALSAFGDGTLLLEKYLTRPRHVEIQVFADTLGNVVSLFERDCSLQRRHQKVIEEAPAPDMTEASRAAMSAAAIAAARAIAYVGAGTVEFVTEGEAFYFIEMNTRLQVEHRVTEMITGIDLVEWQIRVASGAPLPMVQEDIGRSGHAIEARLYAEDPRHDFRPSTGRIGHLRLPRSDGKLVQVDTGVREGDRVSVHYDPLIAKVTVWGETRPLALRRLAAALSECEIAGVATNAGLLLRLAQAPDIASGAVDTGYIARHLEDLRAMRSEGRSLALVAAALAQWPMPEDRAGSADPHSPWRDRTGWRLGGPEPIAMRLRDQDGETELRLRRLADLVQVDCAASGLSVEAGLRPGADGGWVLAANGRHYPLGLSRDGARTTIFLEGETHVIDRLDPFAARRRGDEAEGGLSAPMPGIVVAVLAMEGAAVTRGQSLVVLEAMKMEIVLGAPADGTVEGLSCAPGDMVAEGAVLVRFKPGEAKGDEG